MPFAAFKYGPPDSLIGQILYGSAPQLEAKRFYPYHIFRDRSGKLAPFRKGIPGREGRGRVFGAAVYGFLGQLYPSNLPVARDSEGVSPAMQGLLAKAGVYSPSDLTRRYTLSQHAEGFKRLAEVSKLPEPRARRRRGEQRYQDPFTKWWEE
ncbi:hypothetical protein AUJ14_04525 [Candidatus Micrarchaeota archaeon CG1_02_55_22]|nr:MAG: hypothetical protein AUJ14_04525 [Candidatus Micrarchaeota archaeon CG1_02_55_22]